LNKERKKEKEKKKILLFTNEKSFGHVLEDTRNRKHSKKKTNSTSFHHNIFCFKLIFYIKNLEQLRKILKGLIDLTWRKNVTRL